VNDEGCGGMRRNDDHFSPNGCLQLKGIRVTVSREWNRTKTCSLYYDTAGEAVVARWGPPKELHKTRARGEPDESVFTRSAFMGNQIHPIRGERSWCTPRVVPGKTAGNISRARL
jgi:hypothetical protein